MKKNNKNKKDGSSRDTFLAQVSSCRHLEGTSDIKIPQWKFWLVGTETMSVEMGLWATVGTRGSDVTTGQKPYKARESHTEKRL